MTRKKTAYPVIPASRADDIRDIEFMEEADLLIFMAGNQFMVMDELLEEFRRRQPHVRKIFYETLPPGLELQQILAGGALFQGALLTGSPDVYTSVTEESMKMLTRRRLISDYFVYLHNRLVLMVPEGNPAGVSSVYDLGKEQIRVSHPGDMEEITLYVAEMYLRAGGEELAHAIMEEKRAEGTTLFTVVNHRETPLRMTRGTADVGTVWYTDVINARRRGMKVEAVEVGPALDQRDEVNYYIAKLSDAPNPENARSFLEFIKSEAAQDIYANYGFMRALESS